MIVQKENILLKLKTVILLKSFYDIKVKIDGSAIPVVTPNTKIVIFATPLKK
jgi:hypothetical protein